MSRTEVPRTPLRLVYSDEPADIPPDNGGSEPPGGDPLEARVERLENDMTAIKVTLGRIDERLAGMATNLATKSDLEAVRGDLGKQAGMAANLATRSDLEVVRGDLGKQAEMAANLATKSDLEVVRGDLGKQISRVEGALDSKLDVWQFLTVMSVAVTLILAWPRLSTLLGI